MGLLIREERDKLQAGLLAAYLTPNELRQMVKDQLDKNLYEVALGDDLAEIVFKFVEWVEVTNRTEELVTKLAQISSNDTLKPICTTIRDRLAKERVVPVVKPEDYYNACFVSGRAPFVNRRELRRQLKALATDDGPRILVVTGQPVSGKTYTFQLINFLALKLGRFKPIWIDLTQEVKTKLNPYELVRTIGARHGMGEPQAPLGETSDTRQARYFANWLCGKIESERDPRWVVVDGFNNIIVPDDTRDFVQELAIRAATDMTKLRVIMLGYAETLPPSVPANLIRYERLQAMVDKTDLCDFFRKVFDQKAITYENDAIDETAAQVLKLLSADQKPVEHLPQVIHQVMQALLPGDLDE